MIMSDCVRKVFIAILFLLPLAPVVLVANEPEFTQAELHRIYKMSPLKAVPPDRTNSVSDDPQTIAFGKTLFFETRLSGDNDQSCANCHNPELGWSDARPVPGEVGELARHTPTLYNVAYQRWFFWDGRIDSLWAQALIPIEAEKEMDGNRVDIVRLVRDDDALRKYYVSVFGPFPEVLNDIALANPARPLSDNPRHPHHQAWQQYPEAVRSTVNVVFTNLGKVIATFERTITTSNAPFDTYVQGLHEGDAHKLAALSDSAKLGLKIFVGKGQCWLCHTGPTLSDGEFHNINLPTLTKTFPMDPGRYDGVENLRKSPYNTAGVYSDNRSGQQAARLNYLVRLPGHWGAFKTPGLRNVEYSSPYMHQGQIQSLRDVVLFYSTREIAVIPDHDHQSILKPLKLNNDEIDAMVAFLKSLSSPRKTAVMTKSIAGFSEDH